MACRSPITINTKYGPQQVRCKQCLNCRILRQSCLAFRCELEHSTWQSGFFLTLTYADAPEKGDYRHMDQFLKRLRERERYHNPTLPTIRYLSCGEYGSKTGRFHYHSLIWNISQKSVDSLTELWPHGFVQAGPIRKGGIQYVSRYTLKFHAKGKEACVGWSKSPPLGAHGIRALARSMREDGRYKLPNGIVPSVIEAATGKGSIGPLDQTMRREFMREWLADETYNLPNGGALPHLEYLHEKKFGDPVEAQRKHQEERNTFWETARAAKETF